MIQGNQGKAQTLTTSTPGTCSGQSTTVTAVTSGSYFLNWQLSAGGTTGIAAPSSATTTVTPGPSAVTYMATAGYETGSNKVSNGDFELGQTGCSGSACMGFSSDYPFDNSNVNQGEFGVTQNPKGTSTTNGQTYFVTLKDHTKNDGTGWMFYSDGGSNPTKNIYKTSVNVVAGETYVFSSWVANIHNKLGIAGWDTTGNVEKSTNLEFIIDGTVKGRILLPIDVAWHEFFSVFTATTTTTINIAIKNKETAAKGNDFAIDDVGFFKLTTITSNVIVQPCLKGTVTSSNITCNSATNGGITISGVTGGSGSYDFSINGGTSWFGSGTSYTFNSLASGTYNVQVRDAAAPGWYVILNSALTISQLPALSASLTSVNVNGCNGSSNGTITLNSAAGGSGTYQYSKDGGATWGSSSSFTGLPAATYNVQMRDASNTSCLVTYSVTITQPTALSASFTKINVSVCNGNSNGSITVTGSAGGGGTYEYSKNGGSTWQASNVFGSLTAGTYDIRMRDAASTGCTFTAPTAITITQPTALSASFTRVNVTGCNGNNNGSITVTASAGGGGTYEYSRNGGTTWQSSNVFASLIGGTYDIRMRDAANPACTYTVNAAVAITQPAALTAGHTVTNVSGCNGNNNGSITITGSAGGGGTYEYSRNGGTSWQSSNVFSSLTAGTYDLRMRDAANPTCTYTVNAAVAVTQPAALSAANTVTNVSGCNGNNNGSITVTASSGGGGTYEYSRNGGTTWQSSNVFGSLTAGTYDIRIRDAANPTCTYTVNATVTVTQPSALSASFTKVNVTVCNGNNNGSITVTGSAGGGGTYEYSRNGGTTWQASNVFGSLTAGTYDIRMRDAASTGCIFTAPTAITITQPASLTASHTVTNISGCNGNNNGSITVTGSAGGGGTYEYSRNGGTSWQSSSVFGSLTAGTYDLRMRDAANPTCTYTINAAVTITQPVALSASFTKVDVTVCNGNNNASITVTASAGGGGTYEYSRNGGTTWQSSNLFGSLTAGTYDIRMRDAANPACTYTVNPAPVVTQPTALNAAHTVTNVSICNGNNNGGITVTASAGGGGTYEYSRNGGTTWQSSNMFGSLTAGTYDIRMRDAANPACTYTVNAAVTLTQPTALSASFTRVNVTSCNGNNNGSITVTASAGGGGTYEYSRNGGTTWQSSNVFGALTAGTYDVRMRDAANTTCTYTVNAAVSITQPAALSASFTKVDVTVCNGNNNGSITITGSAGGGGTYEYSRNGGTSWQSSSVFGSLTAGTYDIRMRDAANPTCTYTINAAVIVTQPSALSASFTKVDVSSCNGNNNGSITVTGSSGGGGTYEYSRNGGTTWQSSNVFGSLTAGTYDIRMRDAANPTCTYIVNAALAITQPSALSASFTKVDVTVCNGNNNGSITVTGSAGGSGTYGYSRNGGTTWQASNVFGSLTAGTYDIRMRDAANPTCTYTVNAAVAIAQPAALTASHTVTNVSGCNGNINGSITVTASAGGGGTYEYSRNGGTTWQSSNVFGSLTAGTYDIRMRDAANPTCTYTVNAAVVLTQPTALSASFTKVNVTVCSGNNNGSITVTGSAGGGGTYEYSKNGGTTWQSSNVFGSLTAGTYDIRMRDAASTGCTFTALTAITITQPTALSASFTKTDATGCTPNGTITVTASAGGSGTYGYSANGGTTWQSSNVFTALSAGSYNVQIRDAANPSCIVTVNGAVVITQPGSLGAGLSATNVTGCFGNFNGSITVTGATGGGGSYEYSKNGGSTWQSSNTFSSLSAGSYDIRIRDAASPGCPYTVNAGVVITEPAILSASIIKSNVSGCTANGSITATASAGGSGNYEYSRNGGSTWQTSNVFASLAAGTYNILMRDAASTGCIFTAPTAITITQPPALSASFAKADVSVCNGNTNGSITITSAAGGSGTYEYSSNGGGAWQTSNIFASLAAGTYDVRIRDAANPTCTYTVNAAVSITQPAALSASFSQVNITDCNGSTNGSITVTASAGGSGSYEYSKNGGTTWQASNVFGSLAAGAYDIRIRDAANPTCTFTINTAISITQPAALSASFSQVNITNCYGSINGSITVTGSAGGSGSYEFSKNGGSTWQVSNAFNSLSAGTYNVQVRDAASPACNYTINPSVVITQPSALGASVSAIGVTGCFGNSNGSITVIGATGGSGSYGYTIDGGVTWQSSNVFTSLPAGLHDVKLRDAANPGCIFTINSAVSVTQPPALSASYSQVNVTGCYGNNNGSITVSGSSGGGGSYEYTNDGGSTWQISNLFPGLSAGTYHVQIRDAASPGCIYTVNATIVITQPVALNATFSQINISDCYGSTTGSITVNASAGGSGTYEYSKNGGTTWQASNVFGSLTAGTYDIRMRDAASPSCTYSINGTVNITQPAELSGGYTSTQVTGCNGNTNGSINVTSSAGGSGAYEYSRNGGSTWQASNLFGPLSAGTYNIQMRDAANPGCTYTINAGVSITQPAALNAAYSKVNVTGCYGNANGNVTVTGATGGGGTYEYTNDGGATWQSSNAFNSLSAGSYAVQIRDAASPACVYTVNAAVVISQPAALSASFSQVNISDCYGSSTGSITVTAAAGGSGSYEYSRNGGTTWQLSNVFGSLTAGNYDMRMRDAANPSCAYTVNPSVSITQPDVLSAGYTANPVTGCSGNSNGSITITFPAGGSGTYEYSRNGGSTWQASNLFGSLSAGTYDIRMRDAAHPACTNLINAAVSMTQPAALNAGQLSTQVIGCNGNSNGSITVISETGGSGVYEYSRDGGIIWQTSNVFNSLTAGTYDIRMHDAASPACTFTMNPAVTITQPAALNAAYSKVNVTGCYGNANGSVAVTGATGGGGTYEYANDGGATWQSSNAFNFLPAGSYAVQIRDAASPACVYTVNAAVVISQPAALSASFSQVNISDCYGSSTGSITVTAAAGGSGSYEYSRNGGTIWQLSNVFGSLTAGNYDMRMRDAANPACAYTVNAAVTITQPAALNATYSQVNVNDCYGNSSASITLNGSSGGSGAYEYTIDGGTSWQSSNVFIGLSAGTYNVKLRDAGSTGCIFTANTAVVITQPTALSASFIKSNATGCTGNGSITISGAAGGGGTFEYSNDGGTTWQAANVFTNLLAGSYNVSIRDAVSTTCTHTINPAIVITQPGSLSGSVASTDVTGCHGNSNASITITGSAGGSGAYEYTIDGSNWQTSNLFNSLTAASYNVQLRDAASPTCTYTINTAVIITQPTALSAAINQNNATGCTPDGSIAVTAAAGGSGTYEYTIDGGLTWQAANIFTNLSAGTYNVQLRDAASPACSFTVNPALVVTQPASLGGSVSTTHVTGCYGNTNAGITVTGSSGGSGTYEYTIDGGLTWQASNIFINLSAGSYNVQLRDAASPACTFTVNGAVVITQPTALSAGSSQVNVSDCNGSSTGSITVTVSTGGSGTYEYSRNGGSTWQASNIFGSLTAGTYAVQMRDAANSGCIFTALTPITISQPAALSASLIKSDATGCTSNGSITVTSSSGGSGSYEYTINGGGSWQTSNLFGALAGGTYNVQIRDAVNPACVVIVNSSVVITQPGPLGGGISASQVTGCNGNSNGSITVTGSTGGSGSYEYSNNGGSSWQTSNIFNSLFAGTYNIRMRDATSTGCIFTALTPVIITQPAALSASLSQNNITDCYGSAAGSITVTSSAGGSGTYEYSGNGGSSWQSSNIFSSLPAGSYHVQIRDAVNSTCTYTVNASVVITQPAVLSAGFTSTNATGCIADGSITVTGAAGGSNTYQYSNNGGTSWQSSNVFNALSAGNFNVQLRDAVNPACTFLINAAVTITQPGPLGGSISTVPVTGCNGNSNGSITVTGSTGGSGSYEYSDNGGSSWQASNLFTALPAGTYNVQLRDAASTGCIFTALTATIITQPTALSAGYSQINATGCTPNGSITVTPATGGSGSYEYSINGGSTWQSSNIFNSLSAGSYNLELRDAASIGCTYTIGTVVITQPGSLGGSVSTASVSGCNGNSNGSIAVTGSTGGSGSYEYSNNGGASWQTSNIFNSLSAGTYAVQLRDAASTGCIFTARTPVIITQPTALSASHTVSSVTICNGNNNGSIAITGSAGGSGTYEYSANGGTSWQSSRLFGSLIAGTYDIWMRDAGYPTCTIIVNAAVAIIQPAALSASHNVTHASVCYGNSNGSITITGATGGSGSFEYSNNGGASWQTSNIFNSLSAGTYNIQLRDAASTGCIFTALTPVIINQPVALSASFTKTDVTTCNGNNNGSITITGSAGGSGAYEYSSNSGTSWQSSDVFGSLTAGTYNIRMRDAVNPTCSYTVNATVTVIEPVALSASVIKSDATGCTTNGSIIVTSSAGGSGTYEYSIDGGGFWQSSNVFNSLSAGTYHVQIRDAASMGCIFTVNSSVIITQPGSLGGIVSFLPVTGCNGNSNGSITVNGSTGGSGTYEYTIDGSAWQAANVFTNLPAGTYSVEIRDAVSPGCTFTASSSVIINQPAPLFASSSHNNITDCNGSSSGNITVLGSTGGSGTYEYSKDGGIVWQASNVFNSLTAGTYNIRMRDAAQMSCNYTVDAAVAVSQPTALNASLISANATGCTPDGSIKVTASTGGSGSYEYTINGGGSWQTSNVFGSLAAGTYNVQIRDAASPSCIITVNSVVTITQPGSLGGSISSFPVSGCNGNTNGSITVTGSTGGSGTYEYAIDGSTWQASYVFNALAAGTYHVKLRDAANPACTFTVNSSAAITQPIALSGSYSHINITDCNGSSSGSITVTGSTGGSGTYDYSSDAGATWQASNVFGSLAAGTYYIRMRDAANPTCTFIVNAAVSITQPTALSASFTKMDATGCTANGSITVSSSAGGNGVYEYSINGGSSWQTSNVFGSLAAGSYNVLIRDAASPGCIVTVNAAVVITQPGSLSASVFPVMVSGCNGNSNANITLTGSSGGSGTYEYTIDGSTWQPSNVFNGLSAGGYNVQLRDAANPACTFTVNSSLSITEPAALSASWSENDIHDCNGSSSGSITVNSSAGGSGNYDYRLNSGSWQASNIFNGLITGSYNVQLRDAANPACIFTVNAAVLITEPAALSASWSENNIHDCNGSSSGSITIIGSNGGSGTYEYTIDGNSWQSSNVFNGLTAGTYSVQIRDAASTLCIATVNSALTITQPGSLGGSISFVPVSGCNGNSNGSITITGSTGGSGTYEYTINAGATWQASNVFNGLAAGSYNVQLRDAANPSCTYLVNAAVPISQPTALSAAVMPSNATGCTPNGSITVTGSAGGSGNYEYTNNGSIWQTSNVFTNLSGGTYNVQIRDAASPSCSTTVNGAATITQPGSLVGSISFAPVSGCNGNTNGSITVTGSTGGSGTYDYTIDGNTWKASNVFNGLTAGSYNVQLRDAASPSCIYPVNTSLAISQPVMLSASVDSSNINCFGLNNGEIIISTPAGGSGLYKYSINNGSTYSANPDFTSLAPGVYQVLLQDSMNQTCRVSLNNNLILTEPVQLNATIDSSKSTCNGINDASISIAYPTGGSGFYKYSINNGTTFSRTGSFSSLAPGTYNVVIQDSIHQNCFVALNSSLVLSQPAVMNAVLDSNNATCFGANDGVINIFTPTGGSGFYKYSIDGGMTYSRIGNFSSLAPGTYQVVIQDSINKGCNISLNSDLEISQPHVLSALVDFSNATCHGLNDASITIISVAGGSGLYKYSINNGSSYSANPTFTSLSPGVYQVILQDSIHKGCKRTLNSNLVLNQPGMLGAIVDTINPTCNGNSDASIVIGSSTGGSGRYKYSIDGGTTYYVSGTFDSLPAGLYQIVIQDSIYKACRRALINNFEILPTPVLSASISSTNINCYGAGTGEIIFSTPTGGSGFYKYSIDGGASFFRSGSFSDLASGAYQVVIQDSLRKTCRMVLNNNLQLTQNSVLSASLDSSNTTCSGTSDGTIIITSAMGGSGFYKYSIDGGRTYLPTRNYTALAPGAYQVMLQDSLHKGCTISLNSDLRISAPALLAATIDSANINCFGASNGEISFTSATGGSGFYKYSINNGASFAANANFTNLPPGTYQLVLQDSLHKNCRTIVNSNVILSQPARLFANVLTQDVSTCFGDSNGIITLANATGGSGNYEFALNNIWGAVATYNNLLQGTYRVDIRDRNNPSCTVLLDGAVSISQPAKLEAQVSYVNPSGCSGSNNGAINVTLARGGNGTYEYSNNGGASWISNGIAHNFTLLGTGTYQVRIRDAQHTTCVIVLDTLLLVHPSPAQPTAITMQPVGAGPVCEGSVAAMFNVTASGTDLKYSWRADGTMLSEDGIYLGTGSSNLIIKNSSINLNGVLYDVVVTGNCGILESDKVSLTVTPQTQAGVLSTAQPMCIGGAAGPISLTGHNGQITGWEKSEPPFTSWTSIPFSGDTYYPGALMGTFRYRALVQNGQCQQLPSTQTVVQVQPMPSQAIAGPDQVTCENFVNMAASLPLSGSGSWKLITGTNGDLDNQLDHQTKFTGVPGTDYLMVWQVTNPVCPASTDTVRITLGEKVTSFVNADQSIEEGEEAQLEAGGGSSYDWHADATLSNNKIYNPVASPQKNTVYTVIVSNEAGCKDSASVTVFVQEFSIPNTFSPNDDGNHDNWRIQSIGKYQQASMQIYNRWGQTVGTMDSPEAFLQGWDGKSNGAELPVGTYFYILKLGDGEEVLQGSVSILR